MDKIVRYLLLAALLCAVTSCIKDDSAECPPEYTIQVFIKDKNYTNIGQVTQLKPMDESLPFDSFSGNVYYTLRSLTTGQVVIKSGVVPVTDHNQAYTIEFNNIPYDQYELTVWGNADSNADPGVLHNNETESTDLYMGTTTLTFSSEPQYAKLMLERTKGKLLVLCNNFPSTITSIEQEVGSIYQTVNSNFEYSGSIDVKKTFMLDTMLQTVLAPTIDEKKSTLNLEFLMADSRASSSSLAMPEVELTIKKDEITVVSINYDDIVNTWEIWTYIDGKWTLVHRLDI